MLSVVRGGRLRPARRSRSTPIPSQSHFMNAAKSQAPIVQLCNRGPLGFARGRLFDCVAPFASRRGHFAQDDSFFKLPLS